MMLNFLISLLIGAVVILGLTEFILRIIDNYDDDEE